ncbi:ABC transporter permease [Gracilinema caldarium]|uniref:Lipopolysaccharide assembly protein A domain-containing protein n=1 Tax=Gracilinema caldarium (strain ATCC 51460 / DSM 7334 / H1) TaxID=744872 RepID=F8F0D9_GRAC1|nr:ABC transporter permease [Gracilinema caldarium]AEJ19283.1 hypothetical protein Spica_1137 [Gracilinema caldarium DSM 7334]
MPGRLIGIAIGIGLLVAFISLNLHNVTDISFGFFTLTSIPVFLTILASFALGLIAALPTVFSAWLYAHRLSKQVQNQIPTESQSHTKQKRQRRSTSKESARDSIRDSIIDEKDYGID